MRPAIKFSDRTLLMLRDIARMIEERGITIDAYVPPHLQRRALEEAYEAAQRSGTEGSPLANEIKEELMRTPLLDLN